MCLHLHNATQLTCAEITRDLHVRNPVDGFQSSYVGVFRALDAFAHGVHWNTLFSTLLWQDTSWFSLIFLDTLFRRWLTDFFSELHTFISHWSLDLPTGTQPRLFKLLRSKSESLTSLPKLVLCPSPSCHVTFTGRDTHSKNAVIILDTFFSPLSPLAHFQAPKFLPKNYLLTLSLSFTTTQSRLSSFCAHRITRTFSRKPCFTISERGFWKPWEICFGQNLKSLQRHYLEFVIWRKEGRKD